MKNVCPNQPRLKEGVVFPNPNSRGVVSTNSVTMQTNLGGKEENPREPIVVVTTRS